MAAFEYTQAALYKKYVYQVNIKLIVGPRTTYVARFDDIANWITNHMAGSYKLVCHHAWQKLTRNYAGRGSRDNKSYMVVRLYIDNITDYNTVLEKYKSEILLSRHPFNDKHADVMRNGGRIEIRSQLYYRKYEYRVQFKNVWSQGDRNKLSNELTNILYNDDLAVNHQTYRLVDQGTLLLYLKDFTDMTMIKLAMGEQIYKTTMAYVIPDVTDTTESNLDE
jgi:hypothetical protein